MADLTLSEIWIYPIKSLGGVRLSSARVFPKGLRFDRRWMLIDEAGNFITQRIHSRMALFKLSFIGDIFTIRFQDDTIQLPVNAPVIAETIQAIIWDDTVKVAEVAGEYSAWFSQRLGFSCRLVHFPETNPRSVDEKYNVNDDHVSLADAYPFLIIGQSSLDDLNNKLSKPVPMNRFRPNFVFTGGISFEEDNWRKFTIGNNRFIGVKPCGRCTLITVNQDTAEKGIEPLATLTAYRKTNNKVYFGQNLVAIDNYEVHEGDKIRLDA